MTSASPLMPPVVGSSKRSNRSRNTSSAREGPVQAKTARQAAAPAAKVLLTCACPPTKRCNTLRSPAGFVPRGELRCASSHPLIVSARRRTCPTTGEIGGVRITTNGRRRACRPLGARRAASAGLARPRPCGQSQRSERRGLFQRWPARDSRRRRVGRLPHVVGAEQAAQRCLLGPLVIPDQLAGTNSGRRASIIDVSNSQAWPIDLRLPSARAASSFSASSSTKRRVKARPR